MTGLALSVALALLGALAVLQVLLIAGAPLGRFAWGGTHTVLPPRLRVAAGAAIALYGAFAVLLARRAEVLPGGATSTVVVLTWVLLAYSALSIVPNALSPNRHERAVMTPVSVALTAAVLVVALAPPLSAP